MHAENQVPDVPDHRQLDLSEWDMNGANDMPSSAVRAATRWLLGRCFRTSLQEMRAYDLRHNGLVATPYPPPPAPTKRFGN